MKPEIESGVSLSVVTDVRVFRQKMSLVSYWL